jgi:hypothetical protein
MFHALVVFFCEEVTTDSSFALWSRSSVRRVPQILGTSYHLCSRYGLSKCDIGFPLNFVFSSCRGHNHLVYGVCSVAFYLQGCPGLVYSLLIMVGELLHKTAEASTVPRISLPVCFLFVFLCFG